MLVSHARLDAIDRIVPENLVVAHLVETFYESFMKYKGSLMLKRPPTGPIIKSFTNCFDSQQNVCNGVQNVVELSLVLACLECF